MKRSKTTFSQEIKKEIVSLTFNTHCMKALLSSFLTNKLIFFLSKTKSCWQVSSPFKYIIDFIEKIFHELYDVQTRRFVRNKTSYLEIYGNYNQIKSDLCLYSQSELNTKLLNLHCCKRAYVAGAFLSGGSISDLSQKKYWYHLEIRSENYKYLLFIQSILVKNFNLYVVLYRRNLQYILYIKKASQISDFLKLVNATECLLKFEDLKISRDFNMQITRLNNLDISNIKKTTISSQKQIAKINKIKKTPSYKRQNHNFKLYCQLRLEHPGASLQEIKKILAKKYKINIARTSLQHYVNKINKIYKETQ